MRRAVRMWEIFTSWTPITMSRPASAEVGIFSTRPESATEKRSSHTPCRTADQRVRAPAATLVALRTMTPVTGRPPSRPETVLAAPWPTSSRSRFVLAPSCMRSVATAESRDSTLAMSATVSTPRATAPQLPVGISGRPIASMMEPFRRIRSTFIGTTRESTVAAVTATRAPGTRRHAAGSFGQSTITAITTRPTARSGQCRAPILEGSSVRFCSTELREDPPSRTWACWITIVTPMPASMACTTTGEMASAARAIRLRPSPICTRPAATVIAVVTFQPKVAMSSATTTVRPAAGPLTSSGDPPIRPPTMPPMTPAMRPAMSGAPDASAIPRDSGSATRKTTIDDGPSKRAMSLSFSCMGTTVAARCGRSVAIP